MKVKKSRFLVHIRVMFMRWPLWFSNDFQDIEQIAPISDALEADAFAINELFANLTYWDAAADNYRWKTNDGLATFNKTSRRFAVALQKELGKTYQVLWPLAESSRENKDHLVTLKRKPV